MVEKLNPDGEGTMNDHLRLPQLAAKICGLALALLVVPAEIRADALPDFTGYTRPGAPAGKAAAKGGQIVFVSDAGERKQNAVLGGTVYFTVVDTWLDLEENDTWRKISRDAIRDFVPGKDSRGVSSPAFDKAARYVYLYQTVNDMPNAQSAVRFSTVYLPDPDLLTSWGHFSGHGFTALVEQEDKEAIRPVSFADAVDGDQRVYRNPDSHHITEKLFRIDRFPTRSVATDIQPAAAGDDPVRDPSSVVLTSWPGRHYRGALGYNSYSFLWGRGPIYFPPRHLYREAGSDDRERRPGADRDRNRLHDPNIRAVWGEKNLLQPKERGALFGFTSDYPPVYEDVQLRGPRVKAADGVRPAAGDEGIQPAAAEGNAEKPDAAVKPAADAAAADPAEVKPAAAESSSQGTGAAPAGEVPVPVATAAGGGGWVGDTAGWGSLGGFSGGSGSSGGGVIGAGAYTGAPPASGGSGSSGGTGGGDQGQSQPQDQSQSQNQSQSQTGGSGGGDNCGCEGNIVPEPPAWLMMLIGAPGLAWVWYTRRRAVLA
jgi:hypothetical protein